MWGQPPSVVRRARLDRRAKEIPARPITTKKRETLSALPSLTPNYNFLERDFGIQCNRSGVAAERCLEVPKNTIREEIGTLILRCQCRGLRFQNVPLARRCSAD